MKKSIIALLCAAMIGVTSAPITFADTYINTSFTGVYKSAGATDTSGATMSINFIDNNTFTLQFSYKKDGRENFVYTFDQGAFNDIHGTVRFTAVRHDGAYTPTGTMTLELRDDRILVSCDTDDGVHLFNGDMIKQSDTIPNIPPTTDPTQGGNQNNTDVVQRATANVVINGTKYEFNADQQPFIQDGRTYVPLRSVFSTMGMNVYWADYQYTDVLREQSITCVKNNTIVKFSRSYNDTGSNTWALTKWVDAETSDTSAGIMINTSGMQPIIENGTSYVPLRVISEAFGIEPQWDDSTKTVIITCDTESTNKLPAETISLIEQFTPEMAAQYVTSDFTDVVTNSYPHYDSQSKYYLFDAKDQYGDIYLKISYGGYVTVIPKTNVSQTTDINNNIDEPSENIVTEPTTTPEAETDNIVQNSEEVTMDNDSENMTENTDYTSDTTTEENIENENL